MTEKINHPLHYGGDVPYEAIKVIEAWGLGYSLGNAVKYISRAGKKPGADPIEDLEKASWYVRHEIERLQKERAREEAKAAYQAMLERENGGSQTGRVTHDKPVVEEAAPVRRETWDRLVPRMDTNLQHADGTPKTDTNRHANFEYQYAAPKFQIDAETYSKILPEESVAYVRRAPNAFRMKNSMPDTEYGKLPNSMKERYLRVDGSTYYALRRDWLSEDDIMQLPKYEFTMSAVDVGKSPSWLGALYVRQNDAADGQFIIAEKYREALRV